MGETSDPTVLIVAAVLALAVLGAAVRGATGGRRPGPLFVLIVGGGISQLYSILLYGFVYGVGSFLEPGETRYSLMVLNSLLVMRPSERIFLWLADGLFWLLLFYVLQAVRLGTWTRRVVAVFLVSVASIFYSVAMTLLHAGLAELGILNLSAYSVPSSMQDQLLRMYSNPGSSMGLITAAIQLWLISAWLKSPSARTEFAAEIRAVGLKGIVMSKFKDQSARLFTASVLFNHGGARNTLLAWLKDENRAIALEPGLDLRLAAQMARFSEHHARKGWWIYFCIFCITALGSLVTIAVLPFGAVVAAVFWYLRHTEERESFAPLFRADRYDPKEVAEHFPAELEAEDLAALPTPDQNFFVYGGFAPFVGAGHDIGGWSVVIALDKPKAGFGPASSIKPFAIPEVYGAIDAGLEDLNVRGVEKMDSFFAHGTDVRGEQTLLPNIHGRPVRLLNGELAARYKYADDEKVRHYRCYRIQDWGGELALSYYIRCSSRGNTLFVETKRFVLTPLNSSFHTIDRMVPMEFREKLASGIGAIIAGPLQAAVSPFWAFGEISRIVREAIWFDEARQRREMVERNPLFNYGAETSLRQSVSSGAYGHYFQKMDGDLYNKLFEHEVLDSLVEFLDAHGIDTSDLKERQTTILNNGVMVQGGDIKAESLAVGAGAQAMKKVRNLVAAPAAAKAGD